MLFKVNECLGTFSLFNSFLTILYILVTRGSDEVTRIQKLNYKVNMKYKCYHGFSWKNALYLIRKNITLKCYVQYMHKLWIHSCKLGNCLKFKCFRDIICEFKIIQNFLLSYQMATNMHSVNSYQWLWRQQ